MQIKIEHDGAKLVFGDRPEYGDKYRLVSINDMPTHRFMDQHLVFFEKSVIDKLR